LDKAKVILINEAMREALRAGAIAKVLALEKALVRHYRQVNGDLLVPISY
jgi:hypothetical protein